MAHIDELLKNRQNTAALKQALEWRLQAPAELLPLVALGRAYLALEDLERAARAFGSILDLYPSRADMRRMAGNWLELCAQSGLDLAVDTYRVAMKQRPDHPSVYHQLAMTLIRLNRYHEAFEVLEEGLEARRIENRFPGVIRILKEGLSLVGQSWMTHKPEDADEILRRLSVHQLTPSVGETLRFVLTWETDANDVDFHIFDEHYNHAFYRRKSLPNQGGELYADVTSGYGPECFTIASPKKSPYRLKAHYYRRGPMGYGAGQLQIIRHDGHGQLAFENRPFVIMQDGAYVDLGEVTDRTALSVH